MAVFRKLFGKYVYILAAFGLFGAVGLFAFLQSLGLVIWCEDKVCEAGIECPIYCTVHNPRAQSVYLYNEGDWPLVFEPEVLSADIYTKYYGKWRYTNFTKETRLGNIPESRKYVFVFPARSTKEFEVRVVLNDTRRIKWDFGVLDPLIVGYEKVYAQKTIQKPIYEEKEVIVKSAYNETTDSWSKEYTYTEQVLIGYEEVNISTKRQIGVVVDEVKYLNANVKNDMLVRWTVPIGDRNFEEYGRCRAYEIEKGVCSEVKLI